MKNLILRKSCFVIFTFIFLPACSKSSIEHSSIVIPQFIASEIDAAESFSLMNNAIVRFDPLYLQVIYKDTRTRIQIQQASTALIIEINKNPNNMEAQNELTRLYHFDSFLDLQKASAIITSSFQKFTTTYFINNQLPTAEQQRTIIAARKIFIKNKIADFKEAGQKRTTGLWNDMADEIERNLHYWILVQNEELELENGGSAECKDACCYEYKACLTKAASAYRLNFLTLGSGLAAAGGSLGALYGSVIPFIGTTAVGIGGITECVLRDDDV